MMMKMASRVTSACNDGFGLDACGNLLFGLLDILAEYVDHRCDGRAESGEPFRLYPAHQELGFPDVPVADCRQQFFQQCLSVFQPDCLGFIDGVPFLGRRYGLEYDPEVELDIICQVLDGVFDFLCRIRICRRE